MPLKGFGAMVESFSVILENASKNSFFSSSAGDGPVGEGWSWLVEACWSDDIMIGDFVECLSSDEVDGPAVDRCSGFGVEKECW
jgi:hypothetical protein